MKKTNFLILLLMIGSLLAINIDFNSLINCLKMKYSIQTLKTSQIVYIPSNSDLIYYTNNNLSKNERKNIYNSHLVDAIYSLQGLSENQIQKLLLSESPNLRIYGYIYYLRRNQDIHFQYLLDSFENDDKVFLQYEHIHEECYVRDVLLLITLRGVDLYDLLPVSQSFLYDLTYEQLEILRARYEKGKSFNEYMDMLINGYFDLYWK